MLVYSEMLTKEEKDKKKKKEKRNHYSWCMLVIANQEVK
jgi:hypothetical protein